ncbi:potassium voltage-gated channel subfamily S member 2 [Lates japonicus]|uniref:Potassium voltage-gated channel subfamily S member 2 n=1 Tax=Lates japonicus TaxID=270547 RepID=A0AAD3NE87_LATJO|nr:potassium voltage-gated channel subfamily S member 2 [Lates japonicus]
MVSAAFSLCLAASVCSWGWCLLQELQPLRIMMLARPREARSRLISKAANLPSSNRNMPSLELKCESSQEDCNQRRFQARAGLFFFLSAPANPLQPRTASWGTGTGAHTIISYAIRINVGGFKKRSGLYSLPVPETSQRLLHCQSKDHDGCAHYDDTEKELLDRNPALPHAGISRQWAIRMPRKRTARISPSPALGNASTAGYGDVVPVSSGQADRPACILAGI